MVPKFLTGMVVILALYVLAAWGISTVQNFSAGQLLSVKISGIIATLNVVIAFFVIYFTKDKKQEIFVRFFLGTMVIRLLLLLAVIFMVLKLSTADQFTFIGSLFVLYFTYQVWELVVVSNYFKKG